MATTKPEKKPEMTEDEILELQEKMGGDEWSGSAPRQAKNFGLAAKRLLGLIAPHKIQLFTIFTLVAGSVLLTVYAPRVTGRAMDVIFSGAISSQMPDGVSKEQVI